jgi:hypothetical protein
MAMAINELSTVRNEERNAILHQGFTYLLKGHFVESGIFFSEYVKCLKNT